MLNGQKLNNFICFQNKKPLGNRRLFLYDKYMKNNKAFTLVELAIVIVIIGLLVGGVLQGQELINQAQIKSQISQFANYDSSSLTFKAKYNYIPGDIPLSLANQLNVSQDSTTAGNGTIDDGHVSVPPNLGAYMEGRLYFTHLSRLKFIKDHIQHTSQNYSVDVTFPRAELGDSGIAPIGHIDGMYWFLGPTVKNNTDNAYSYSVNSAGYALTPAQSFGLDMKLDDGIPSSGIFRVVNLTNISATNFRNATAPANTCLGASDQVYNITSDRKLCRVIVKSKVY